MKPRALIPLMFVVGAMSLMFAWLLITPIPGVYADIFGGRSTVAPNLASTLEQQTETVRLAHTSDITFTPAYTASLPLIINTFPPPLAGIYGTVTYQGIPIDGLEIQLWLCNRTSYGWSCSPARYTTTQWGGRYQFTTADSLGSNQKYVVEFNNSASDARFLDQWKSFSLNTYTAGQVLAGGDFDVADMVLLLPPNFANSGLPVTFEWELRIGAPTDNYMLELYKPNDMIMFGTPRLGYTGSYTLSSLPAGFTTGVQYGWYVWIFGPGDSVGYNNQYREITFH